MKRVFAKGVFGYGVGGVVRTVDDRALDKEKSKYGGSFFKDNNFTHCIECAFEPLPIGLLDVQAPPNFGSIFNLKYGQFKQDFKSNLYDDVIKFLKTVASKDSLFKNFFQISCDTNRRKIFGYSPELKDGHFARPPCPGHSPGLAQFGTLQLLIFLCLVSFDR